MLTSTPGPKVARMDTYCSVVVEHGPDSIVNGTTAAPMLAKVAIPPVAPGAQS
jgi:hypothetical protein